MMEVHDRQCGDARFSIVTENGEIKYVQVAASTFTPEEFEAMYQHYIDFDEETNDAEHDAARTDA